MDIAAIIRPALILLIEKDGGMAASITTALERAGLGVLRASDASSGLKKLYESHPDLVIMTGDLPLLNGEEPYFRIRQSFYLPIIVLGNRDEAPQVLELGADVFMTKPPNLPELVARVHSLLRRRPGPGPLAGGNGLSGDSSDQFQSKSGELTATERRLASCLALNRGKMLSYRQLVAEVWGDKSISTDNLHYYMRSLRHKLINGSITMLRGIGYCLSEPAKVPAENEEVVPMGNFDRTGSD